MPLNLVELSALPECHGKRWSIGDEDRLATLTAIVLRGLAQHAEMIIRGAQPRIAEIADALKQQLHKQLFTPAGPLTYQRDGLLFEIISWIAASLTAQRGEIVSMPHLKSTQQGLDTIKVSFDEGSKRRYRRPPRVYET